SRKSAHRPRKRGVSTDSIGERSLDRGARVQGAQHRDAFDGVARERRSDIGCDAYQAQYLDAQPGSRLAHGLEITTRELVQAEQQRAPFDGLAHDVRMRGKKVSDRCAD